MNIWEDWDRECRARGDLWEGGTKGVLCFEVYVEEESLCTIKVNEQKR